MFMSNDTCELQRIFLDDWFGAHASRLPGLRGYIVFKTISHHSLQMHSLPPTLNLHLVGFIFIWLTRLQTHGTQILLLFYIQGLCMILSINDVEVFVNSCLSTFKLQNSPPCNSFSHQLLLQSQKIIPDCYTSLYIGGYNLRPRKTKKKSGKHTIDCAAKFVVYGVTEAALMILQQYDITRKNNVNSLQHSSVWRLRILGMSKISDSSEIRWIPGPMERKISDRISGTDQIGSDHVRPDSICPI
ncbi:Uncharacterized protein Fot_09917 [Forsythia ovata]|uniref:Uncharacterized protein n=1 Tax=Forsythia ovata TaxID=205694 RepID=A0ABD1WFP9_9LAMI